MADFFPNRPAVVSSLDVATSLEQIDDRKIGCRLPIGRTAGLQDQAATRTVGMRELPEQPRLADAWLTDDGDDLTPAGLYLLERFDELTQFVVAAYESGQSLSGGDVEPRAAALRSRELVDVHRLWHALDGKRPDGRDQNVAFSESPCGRTDEDAARLGQLLHPRGEMRGLADRRVVHVQIAANRAHDDLAGVEPDADFDDRGVRAPHLLGVSLHALLHEEGGIACAHRVVFVSKRRTEQRHDAVAHHLVDGAFEPMHGLHHPFEHGVEYLARFLGITVGEQLHRALQIGEEHRDLLALAL